MPPTTCAVIDSERCLTPARALPLRCRLASAKMRSGHLLCMDPRWCAVSPLTTTPAAMIWPGQVCSAARPGPGGGQTQEAAFAEPAVCDEFRGPARSAIPGHRREGDARVGEAEVLMEGIVFGESPRWHDGRLWFSDWGA